MRKGEFWGRSSVRTLLQAANYAFLLAEYEQPRVNLSLLQLFHCVMRSCISAICTRYLSDRGKNIFGYLGLSALCGYEELNEDKRLLPVGLHSWIGLALLMVERYIARWNCS